MTAEDDSVSRSRRRICLWLIVVVIAAIFPVLAQTSILARFATVLWLASMPLCVLGCAMLAREAALRHASKQDRDD